MMRIAFYAPCKPLNHGRVSGDVTIARDAMEFLVRKGHSTSVASPLETTWLYWKPWRWPDAFLEYILARQTCSSQGIHAWLTYHSNHRSPDFLGPRLARLGLPYFVFSGAYSADRGKSPKTWFGHMLNRRALNAANHVFAITKTDYNGCAAILPDDKLTYIKPGLPIRLFSPDVMMRQKYRRRWGARDCTVIVTSAVMRKVKKTHGVETVIRSCAELANSGKKIMLIVTGDGPEHDRLERLAVNLLPGRVRFLGMIPRGKLYEVFSGADIFAFPGKRERLSMTYLEAQCSGLPVVATDHLGAPEVVSDGVSGIIVPHDDVAAFTQAIGTLVDDDALRTRLSKGARNYVCKHHDIDINYSLMETIIQDTIEQRGHSWSRPR